MYEVTKRVVFHLLAAKGEASFNDVAEIVLHGMPELTGVVPSTDVDEILSEFKLVVLAVWSLCQGEIEVDTEKHVVRVGESCRKRVREELKNMRSEEYKRRLPRLTHAYIDAVDSILF